MWTAYALVGVVCFIVGFGVGFVVGGLYSPYAKAVAEAMRVLREFLEG